MLGSLPLACAVYDNGAMPPIQDGDTPSAGSSPTASSGSGNTSHAGTTNAAGGPGKTSGGASGNGGTANVNAGAGGHVETTAGGEGGAGGDAAVPGGGSASGGGQGGVAGHAGSGGTGGKGAGGNAGGAAGGMSGGSAGTSGSGGAAGTGGTNGTAGSGGTPSGPLCSDHPLTARSTWVASASVSNTSAGDTPPHLLDGAITRWTTGTPQSGDEWLQIDFGTTVTLNHVNLQQGTDTNDYPRSYSVIVSDTAKDSSGSVRLSGSGKSGVSTAILLPALASGRYLLIKQTGTSLSWWSAEEIEVGCAD
jgi:F5/8 type C domain